MRGQEKCLSENIRHPTVKKLQNCFIITVHTVNANDYTKEQLSVWATGQVDLEKWNESLQEHFSVVVVDDESL